MTIERDPDTEPTVEIKRPVPAPAAQIEDVDQDFDPERTLVREDWESEGLRRLSKVVPREQAKSG